MNETLANDILERPAPPSAAASDGLVKSRLEFRTGNEAAALAAHDIGFDLMGFFPVAPAAETGNDVAGHVARLRDSGDHGIVMVETDTAMSAAGVCYGAALGGGRVVGAASADDLLNALQQLTVQAGMRVPMVLNFATRAVSAPLTGAGDHAGLYTALNCGWVILCARDPQAVYDLNFAAVRIGEHPDVRLPVIVAYDGFYTGHQQRRMQAFDDPKAVRKFLGERPEFPTPLDLAHAATFGAAMNDAGVTRCSFQLSLAMDAARRIIPEVLSELQQMTGRSYPMLDAYRMDDAEAAVVLINSAAETAKDGADAVRDAGRKVGVLSPNVLRPFPAEEFREALKRVGAVTVGDRADSFGANGGNLSLEVRAAIQTDPDSRTRVVSRIYGLGGGDFRASDATAFLELALAAASVTTVPAFAYHGATAAAPEVCAQYGLPALAVADPAHSVAHVRRIEATGALQVELEPLWKMTEAPRRIAPGHGACPGCGNFPTLHQIYDVLEGDVIVLFQSGCTMTVSADQDTSAHRISCIHNSCNNGAATLSGLLEMFGERVRRGELPESKDATFVMVASDSSMDAGMGSALAAALRNHRMIILEFDRQMELGAAEAAVAVRQRRLRDSAQIFAACHLPYVFTASEAYPEDLMRKVAKAQWYAKHEGLVYGRILTCCPLNWGMAEDKAESVMQAAIDSCVFPLYEVEQGHTAITYDPDKMGRRRPVADWLGLMDRTRKLVVPAAGAAMAAIEAETGRHWARLQAMHAHPLL